MLLQLNSIQPYKFRIPFIIFLNYQLFIIKTKLRSNLYTSTLNTIRNSHSKFAYFIYGGHFMDRQCQASDMHIQHQTV